MESAQDSTKKSKAEAPVKCAYEKYEVIEVKREELKNAPYNPRVISDKAKKKLKGNLKGVGLLEPIIWNKRTGNIVSGHQRVSCLDSLMKRGDYTLKVSAVDLDEKTEREQNVFMNNPEAQGAYDIEKLGEFFKDSQVEVENTGFSEGDLYQLFGDSPLKESPERLKELSEKLRGAQERREKSVKQIKALDDTNFYLVAVFKSNEERQKFTDALELPDNRYVDGKALLDLLVEIPDEKA